MRDALARGMHEVVLPFSGGTTFCFVVCYEGCVRYSFNCSMRSAYRFWTWRFFALT